MKASKIEWTHSTFNPWWGCEKVSPGCTNCYAEAFAKRVGQKVWGGTSPRRFFGDKHWAEPLKWNAEAARTGEPWRVFCASMADVFEDRHDLRAERARLFDLIERTPALTWLLLTKRPQNVPMMSPVRWGADPDRSLFDDTGLMPRNVWIGATVEGPETAHRISALRAIPAVVRFLSVEPQVAGFDSIDLRGIGWVIQGGESGARSRPFNIEWARWMRDECRRQGTAYLLKQMGAKPVGVFVAGSTLAEAWDAKGGNEEQWPPDLRVREYPALSPRDAGAVGKGEEG